MAKLKLPEDIVSQWPEVFEHINVEMIPVEYVHIIDVDFDDGTTWEINCQAKSSISNDSIAESIEELFDEYGDSIVRVDFRIDSQKVKRDIQKTTRAFLKNPKKFRKGKDGS